MSPQNTNVDALAERATRLRILSIRSTTEAGSGHPSSCLSAADIMSVLFFSVMRYDPKNPGDPAADQFILSKGHAAPILYAAWAEAGAFPVDQIMRLRKIDSDFEGHPTPRLPFVGVATGSLGQGLCAGIGMALNAKTVDRTDKRIYVLLGDGESAEGSVWEAAHAASHYKLNNLCATIDINRLGQSGPTMDEWDIDAYRRRWEAFGWKAIPVDGHDIPALLRAYEEAAATQDRPSIVLAKTVKGKGIPEIEDKGGHHGKPLTREEAASAIRGLEAKLDGAIDPAWKPAPPPAAPNPRPVPASQTFPHAPYLPESGKVATREAAGDALAKLGQTNPSVVVLDGDVKNSTYTEKFMKEFPDRFFEMFIAEQDMLGAAMGFAASGKIAFASTFACFFARAYDFVRMAAIGGNNIKLIGTHAGISIGEDGPSQMGLEDLAMMCAQPDVTVLYPCDGVSAWHSVKLAADIRGPVYIRTARPKTPVLYSDQETFETGRAKVLRQSGDDRLTIVAAGVTVFEALEACDRLAKEGIHVRVMDLFSVQPVDRTALLDAARATGGPIITVEDHYAHGGIGDAVAGAVAEEGVRVYKLAVREIARSGTEKELLDRYGISARAIADKARSLVVDAKLKARHG